MYPFSSPCSTQPITYCQTRKEKNKTKTAINRKVDKQIFVCPCNEILLINKTEQSAESHGVHLYFKVILLSERNQTQSVYCRFH